MFLIKICDWLNIFDMQMHENAMKHEQVSLKVSYHLIAFRLSDRGSDHEFEVKIEKFAYFDLNN